MELHHSITAFLREVIGLLSTKPDYLFVADQGLVPDISYINKRRASLLASFLHHNLKNFIILLIITCITALQKTAAKVQIKKETAKLLGHKKGAASAAP